MPILMTALAAGLALIPLALSGAHAFADTPSVKSPQVENPTHVLFVGNSYFYYGDSLHNHVRRLCLAHPRPVVPPARAATRCTATRATPHPTRLATRVQPREHIICVLAQPQLVATGNEVY